MANPFQTRTRRIAKSTLLYLSIQQFVLLSTHAVSSDQQISLFHPTSVQITEGPFKKSQELNENYLLAHDPDRLLAPFLSEAKLAPKAEKYGNWESSGLDGHSAGHYLSALAYAYASSDDTAFSERLSYMVEELARCQAEHPDGYVGGVPGGTNAWRELASGKVQAERFNLNGTWVPWYNLHKLFVGLKDAWLIADNQQARDVLLTLCDWADALIVNLSETQVQAMLYAEHGGMNDIFAEIYQHTGNAKHLKLAKRFSHLELLDPLLEKRDTLTGLHANTQIPKVIGFERIAQIESIKAWNSAARFFWENIVSQRSIAIGGNSVREHFHDSKDFSQMRESREGPESCNTFNMLRLTALLYQNDKYTRFIDYYERALFNHILSLQHPETGGFVYFTPARSRHYRVYSQAETSFWCCVGTGMENPGRYTELIYAHTKSTLFVNLFIPSQLHWQEMGITLTQKTDFPIEDRSTLTIETEEPKRFTLAIRKPNWCEQSFQLHVNGQLEPSVSLNNGYIEMNRTWKTGDRIDITAPMTPSIEQLPDQSNHFAFLYGPIVLAARFQSEEYSLPGLFAGPGRMEHIAPGLYYPTDQNPILVGNPKDLVSQLNKIEGKELKFTLSGDIRPTQSEPIVLEPFSQIHESRYSLYWQTAEESEYQKIVTQLKERQISEEQQRARIIDSVSPGQQQPEVEHDFSGAESRTGIMAGRQYREASQWFQYTLKHDSIPQAELALTYFGGEWNKACTIEINGETIGELTVKANIPDTFAQKTFSIPSKYTASSDKRLTIRIVAKEGNITPALFEIELRKAD